MISLVLSRSFKGFFPRLLLDLAAFTSALSAIMKAVGECVERDAVAFLRLYFFAHYQHPASHELRLHGHHIQLCPTRAIRISSYNARQPQPDRQCQDSNTYHVQQPTYPALIHSVSNHPRHQPDTQRMLALKLYTRKFQEWTIKRPGEPTLRQSHLS